MNVFLVVVLPFLYYLSFATDIDYVEHTQRQKIINFVIKLCVLAVPTVTAIHLYKSNWLIRKLALIGNYCALIGTIFYIFAIVHSQPSAYMDAVFFSIVFCFFIFAVPFVINLKALRKA
jgi:hypothetical protein